MGIDIVTLLGTARPGNFTKKALALVIDELSKHEKVAVQSIDPAELVLPFPGPFVQGYSAPNDFPDAERIQDLVSNATGVIIATPEYHGTFAAMTKLLIENLGFPSVLSGKPVALLGVAAGQIGAIKSLEQLRGVCSHVGALVLPGAVSVAGVQRVFDADGNCTDAAVEKRVRSVATNLVHYIEQKLCPRLALEAMVREASL